jgi:AraC-like DNA-binding protein/DNA-binding NarL/FixJ family response regulator
MTEDHNGKMWYGTSDDGILDYNGQLASLKVTALACSGDGSVWVGSRQNGLTRIKDGNVTTYSSQTDSVRKNLIDNHIHALATDKGGNLWIGTENGLQMYNTRMETFSNYTKENGKMKNNNITALNYANSNKMLIGTSEGIAIIDLSNSEINYFSGNSTNLKKFTNNYITYVFEDSRGLIWIGTREGVNVLNLETDNLDYLTERHGLCNNNVCGIAEDSNSNIWITTSNGVTRVVVARNHDLGNYDYGLYNYSYSDGLQSNEFNLGSVYKKKDGTVLFGGIYGINWVRPKTADEKEALPRVMLTQLFIGEEEVLIGHEYDGIVPLPQTLNESSRIELTSDQNTFTIKFAAGNYNQSERLQFKYWMEGLDDDWRNGDALKHGVTFTNLKSKTYKLHVKAVGVENAPSNQERVIEIHIAQPWYLQWWMLLFYVVVIITVVYIWKVGMGQLREVWQKKNSVIDELGRQRDEIKSASDDLRQPMSRMTSIIMNLAERESTLEEREQLNSLHSQMLQIITRVSDMQLALEHPEETAKKNVNKKFELNSHGEMNLPEILNDELTSEIRSQYKASPTSKFQVFFIDDSRDFIDFVSKRLQFVYDFHAYDDILKATTDIEAKLPDLVICKQDMHPITGSDLCNKLKTHHILQKVKFVLMTEAKMNGKEMQDQGITLSADEYIAKPFNLQEAAMRFNKLLGIGAIDVSNNLIEGAETRLLEGRNSSMTTSTETIDYGSYNPAQDEDEMDDELKALEIPFVRQQNVPVQTQTANRTDDGDEQAEYSMNDAMDRRLIMSIEQYVQQNMSRGQISLEEMAQAMGMSMRPFFQKVRDITGKTPAEVVRDMRLKYACMLLKRTNINLSELAINVGFATGEHFINVFKDRFGISPSEYRLKYRK